MSVRVDDAAVEQCQQHGELVRRGAPSLVEDGEDELCPGEGVVRLLVVDTAMLRMPPSLPRLLARATITLVRATVVLGVQGRLVVPAEARRELGLAAGDELVLHTEDGRLVLERREDAGRRLRGLYASPTTSGVVNELLDERWHAAQAE